MDCGKNCYKTQRSARLKAAQRCNGNFNAKKGPTVLYVYYCFDCESWHLSRSGSSIGKVTAGAIFSESYIKYKKLKKLNYIWLKE